MIALQCLIPQLLLIDAVEFSCNNITLQWFAVPEMIRDAKTQNVLSNQNHFKGKLISWNLQYAYQPPDIDSLLIKQFKQSNVDKIKTFFTETHPQKIGIFSGLGVVAILILCSLLIYFYGRDHE